MTKRAYFTFPSTHHAIRAEKIISNEALKFKMVPVPRSISSNCGVALCCLPADAPAIKGLLEENSVVIGGIFEL
ncbi:MAG: DUF3343 domain-containing protein [Firmicutes bacterium]|nr:DUF3343 domain-containing protein [Bacillota bacterium]